MTPINTEVLDIRADVSKEVAADGFKAVGNYAMEQSAAGDEAWKDGGTKKTLAHAAMGAAVAAIGNGDALGGALGAGAREAASGATKDQDDATQQIVSSVVGAAAGGGTGASVALDGEKYNRQLHQREIAFLEDKGNIEAFAQYYQDYTGETISLEDAQKILAQGGASLVDKSWNDKVGNDSRVKEAQDFIKENYTDKSAIFYDDEDGMRVGTHGFNASKNEYDDRYANMQGFTEHKDFYQQNLNVGNGNGASASDYVNGAVKPLEDLGKALVENPLDTAEAMGEGIKDFAQHPIDSTMQTGAEARALEEQAQLDTMLGDDQSAAEHRGEAYGGVATAVVGGVVVKGASKGLHALDGAADDALDMHTPSVDAIDVDLGRGPNGGKGTLTEYNTEDGRPIIQREGGGYYTYDDEGKQVRVNSPTDHGNTLNDTPAELYQLVDRDTGELIKVGETTHGENTYGAGGQKRYTEQELREMNAEYKPVTTGTKAEMHELEEHYLQEYKDTFGEYPLENYNGH